MRKILNDEPQGSDKITNNPYPSKKAGERNGIAGKIDKFKIYKSHQPLLKPKKVRRVKCLVIIGKDKKVSEVVNSHGVCCGQMAVYELGTIFSKRIVKEYKLKVLPATLVIEE